MRIVIDSNVLFSALIRNSTVRRMIFEYDGLFLFPSFIFEELELHKSELVEKSGMGKQDFERLLQAILGKVEVVGKDRLLPQREEAEGLVKEIDRDDAVFIACVLAYPGSALWSDDKRLKKIKGVSVLSTGDILDWLPGMDQNQKL